MTERPDIRHPLLAILRASPNPIHLPKVPTHSANPSAPTATPATVAHSHPPIVGAAPVELAPAAVAVFPLTIAVAPEGSPLFPSCALPANLLEMLDLDEDVDVEVMLTELSGIDFVVVELLDVVEEAPLVAGLVVEEAEIAVADGVAWRMWSCGKSCQRQESEDLR
ncbi:MAG: hypothetical protein M1830_009387 [Pleopsidium flavum]|nr:MAG: hypothetical protein M1830_009387 [Pleopsidium flavum]